MKVVVSMILDEINLFWFNVFCGLFFFLIFIKNVFRIEVIILILVRINGSSIVFSLLNLLLVLKLVVLMKVVFNIIVLIIEFIYDLNKLVFILVILFMLLLILLVIVVGFKG